MSLLIAILSAAVRSGTPILYATLGEIITQTSGVMNLGLEGLMLLGAFSGFAGTVAFGSPWFGVAVAFLVGVAAALPHAYISVTLRGNQVVSGLALTMVGTGLSALAGISYVGKTLAGFSPVAVPLLSKIPILGPALFNQDPLVYLSYVVVLLTAWIMNRTRWGLVLRAVGDGPRAADSVGLNVARTRYMATLIGGGLVAIGGAYLSLSYSHMWNEGMTAGRGWIAVALVIFAAWRPRRAALGAYLFGGVEACQLRIQASGTLIPAPLLLMLPYVLTLLVLILMGLRKGKGHSAPLSLGLPFSREERE